MRSKQNCWEYPFYRTVHNTEKYFEECDQLLNIVTKVFSIRCTSKVFRGLNSSLSTILE